MGLAGRIPSARARNASDLIKAAKAAEAAIPVVHADAMRGMSRTQRANYLMDTHRWGEDNLCVKCGVTIEQGQKRTCPRS